MGPLNTSPTKNQERLSLRIGTTQIRPDRREQLINSKLELCTLENGKEGSEMVMVFKPGQMVLNTKVNGVRTELMAKESSSMLMEIFTKVTGQMIRRME